MGHIQASFIVTLGDAMLPLRPGEGLQLGVRGLVLLSLAVDPLLDSAFSPPVALQRLLLELDRIFLARSVIVSSSHSTFQSILGATEAGRGRLRACDGPRPQGLCLTKPFDTVVVFYSSSVLSLLSLFRSIFALFGLFFFSFSFLILLWY